MMQNIVLSAPIVQVKSLNSFIQEPITLFISTNRNCDKCITP